MSTRRKFLANGIAASSIGIWGSSVVAVAPRPLRILILGGTGFIGPVFVRAAVERGHTVAVFNRGRSQADLPASVERLIGDRDGDMSAITARTWDATIDLAAYTPRWVRRVGRQMSEHVRHYTFISSVMVYKDPGSRDSTDERSPVLIYDGRADPYTVDEPGAQYGSLKVLCEREAREHFPSRTLILRSGYIVGPGDPQDHLVFFPERVRKGGVSLMAGDASMPAQFVDVRDLAQSAIRMIENRTTGTYNIVGPAERTSLAQLINAARQLVSTATRVTWVSPAWLSERTDRGFWSQQLFWSLDSLESFGFLGIMRMSNKRALSAGFDARPFAVSMADTYNWFRTQSSERQAQLIQIPRSTNNSDEQPVSWSTYLEQEKRALAEWARTSVAPAARPKH